MATITTVVLGVHSAPSRLLLPSYEAEHESVPPLGSTAPPLNFVAPNKVLYSASLRSELVVPDRVEVSMVTMYVPLGASLKTP